MSTASDPSLAQIAQNILEDALSNIIHNIVVHRHREHKLLLASLDPTTKLPHCETCKLPRLLDPPLAPRVRGASTEPPSNTVYCDRKPWIRRAGHDIYGNPFLKSDVTGRPLTKKEREAKKKDDGTPASEEAVPDGTNAPPSPSADGGDTQNSAAGKLEKGEKKASKIDEKLKKGEYVPWHTCPNCKRSLLITRFAKHLEQCMGLSGRAASRNALAKMNGTPGGSRGGTPNPSQEGKDDDDDDEPAAKGNSVVRKKVLKKGLKEKAKKLAASNTTTTTATNGKNARAADPKRASNSAGAASRESPTPSFMGGEGKRDRDDMDDDDEDDEEEVHVKKRQKLQRMGSTASILSASTFAPEMERGESNDGSFVGDGSVGDD